MRFQDVSAGLAVAGLLLPEAVAYSAIAGLPPGLAMNPATGEFYSSKPPLLPTVAAPWIVDLTA